MRAAAMGGGTQYWARAVMARALGSALRRDVLSSQLIRPPRDLRLAIHELQQTSPRAGWFALQRCCTQTARGSKSEEILTKLSSTGIYHTVPLEKLSELELKEELKTSDKLLVCPHSLDKRVRSFALVNPDPFKQALQKAMGLFIPSVVKEELDELHAQLQPYEAELQNVDQIAKRHADAVAFLGLCALTAQTGLFIYLTYIVYGWDIMEPFSYFVGQGLLMAAYAYFLFIKRDHSLGDMWNLVWKRKRAALLKRRGIDLAVIEQLQRDIKKRKDILFDSKSKL